MRPIMLHVVESAPICTESDSYIPDYASTRNRIVAERIALLIGGEFCETDYSRPDAYYVPDVSLLREEADKLGIETEDDLFGGVVNLKLHRDKAVLHRLVGKLDLRKIRKFKTVSWIPPQLLLVFL